MVRATPTLATWRRVPVCRRCRRVDNGQDLSSPQATLRPHITRPGPSLHTPTAGRNTATQPQSVRSVCASDHRYPRAGPSFFAHRFQAPMKRRRRTEFALRHQVPDREPLVGLCGAGYQHQNAFFERVERQQGRSLARQCLSQLQEAQVDVSRTRHP